MQIFGANVVRGINIDTKIKPQNMKNRFNILSAKKPKTGCSMDEQIFEILITTAAVAMVNPNFAAKNGIIGFKKPVYISVTK